jgi:hypothetical protein
VAHNEGADQGFNSHRLRVNPFADLTNEEFNAQMKGYRPPARKLGAGMQTVFSEEVLGGAAPTQLPATVNWTAQGLVTPVKYQGQVCINLTLLYLAQLNDHHLAHLT